MKNVPSESKKEKRKGKGYITKRDVKEFRRLTQREDDRLMAWVLVVELITYINNNEKTLLAQTVGKAKKNTFLQKDEEFMSKMSRNFSTKDIQYLKKLKETINP